MSKKPDEMTLFGIPIRADATLCDVGEIFLEHADGTIEQVIHEAAPPATTGREE